MYIPVADAAAAIFVVGHIRRALLIAHGVFATCEGEDGEGQNGGPGNGTWGRGAIWGHDKTPVVRLEYNRCIAGISHRRSGSTGRYCCCRRDWCIVHRKYKTAKHSTPTREAGGRVDRTDNLRRRLRRCTAGRACSRRYCHTRHRVRCIPGSGCSPCRSDSRQHGNIRDGRRHRSHPDIL